MTLLCSLLIRFQKGGENISYIGKILDNRCISPNRHCFEMNQKGEFVDSNFRLFDYLKTMSILLTNLLSKTCRRYRYKYHKKMKMNASKDHSRIMKTWRIKTSKNHEDAQESRYRRIKKSRHRRFRKLGYQTNHQNNL